MVCLDAPGGTPLNDAPRSTWDNDAVEEFERANPKIVEAMRVFDMTMPAYIRALQADSAVRLTSSSSTENRAYADLDRGSVGDGQGSSGG